MLSIIIPFSGFYESLHSSEIDEAENMIFQDDSGSPLAFAEKLHENFYWACDYGHVNTEYARAYAGEFAEKMGLKTLKFEALNSPKEYNFTTDRIFCTIDYPEVQRLFNETNTPTLRITARANHTSRDGFYSFYNPDFETWGDVTTWDSNQLATLLEAWIVDNFEDYHDGDTWTQWDEIYLMSGYSSNGYLDNWLCHAPGAERVANIASYLRQRGERAQ
jgi:hypothetical protein